MKKLHLLFVVLCGFTFVSSAADTKLFTGDVAPSMFSRMDMVSWDLANIVTNATYVNFGTEAEPAFARITSNPVKTGLNTSDNALQFSSLKGKSWWPDFANFDLANPITITEENRYLHIYHFRENLNKGFSVNINKDTPWEDVDKGTKRFDMNLSKPGTWEDIVIDLKWFMDNSEALSRICVLMDTNWGGDAESPTNYYFDEIVLNNSNLPRGITILTDTEMSLFPGNTASYTKWVNALDLQNAENTSEIVANPFTTEMAVLNSTSIMKFNKSANAAWWQGTRFTLNGTLPVGVAGASSYLHVMINIPEMEDGKDYYVVQLNVKDFMGKESDSGDAIKYWADDKGKWMDCVFDVTSMGYISELSVRFDVRRNDLDEHINSPAGVFYLDALAINNSEEARVAVEAPTRVNAVNKDNTKIYSRNHSVLVEGSNVASIEVYNLLGSLVKNVSVNASRTEIPVSKNGVYLVRTVSTAGNVYTSKVIVN